MKTKKPASVFNDAIGPVMRGPSSSHVAASARIARLASQLVKGKLKRAVFQFETDGAIAPTYHGHGTDIGLAAGLLGYGPEDERVPRSLKLAREQGIDIQFEIKDYPADHPNTMRIILKDNDKGTVRLTAVSLGGGLIEVREIDGLRLSINGDFYETLLFSKEVTEAEMKDILTGVNQLFQEPGTEYQVNLIQGKDRVLFEIKSTDRLSGELIDELSNLPGIEEMKILGPVMPVVSRMEYRVPFKTAAEMLKFNQKDSRELWELAVLYEKRVAFLDEEDIFLKMKEIVQIMEKSILEGIKGTTYQDRILGPQAWMVKEGEEKGRLINGGVLNNIITYTMTMMEVKSSMGVIVAAPTAGSCGAVPGAILGSGSYLKLSVEDMTRSMLAAGIIGVFISEQATFSAEVCGCQAECGAASAMAAAGLVQLAGGTAEQGVNAASMALQNVLGLICDPVADRVEVPCLGKNVMAATNALAAANMALAGIDPVIPLDEVIDAMYEVGSMLPSELRCTGRGGLSVTKTARNIINKLNEIKS